MEVWISQGVKKFLPSLLYTRGRRKLLQGRKGGCDPV
jgi:hypothetical protein